MTFIGKLTAKIVKKQRRGFIAINPQVVRNFRDPLSGSPTHEIIYNCGTIRSTEIADKADSFWYKTDAVLDTMVANGQIAQSESEEIKKRFSEVIPRPATKPALKIKPKSSSSAEERARERFKNLLG